MFISDGGILVIAGRDMALADYIGKFWAGAEVMYGVIIAMTFTSVLRGVPDMYPVVVRNVVFAALFCCIAWGIADGLFYLWERNYIIRQENRIIAFSQSAWQREDAMSLLGEQLDDSILRNVSEGERRLLYDRISQILSGVDSRKRMSPRDAATIVIGTFLLSAGAGAIVVSPFFVIGNAGQALVVSNLAGIFLLFGIGYFRALERDLLSKVLFGFVSSLIGIIIAVITVVLGG
jgi:VIT1/CCC1 family predicted Fe2+/Mn2+ transporter